jgi:hypothetical protein
MSETRARIDPYVHDCNRCIWVGWIYVKGGGKFGSNWGNMYFCPNHPDHRDLSKYPGSVVIRFSNEPSDYWSKGAGGLKGAIDIGP